MGLLEDTGNSWIRGTLRTLWRTVRRPGAAIVTAQLGRRFAQMPA